jgi:tRNA (guanine-N7-)-methyltransferase
MRNKPWAKPELESSPFYIDDPFHKGEWHQMFERTQPLYLELGCGKGNFVAVHAARHPEINYLGMDLKSLVLASACRHAKAAFAAVNRPIDNLLFTPYDIERILDVMDERDCVDKIYINFCNPWPKERQHKKRLTHPRQLERYKKLLKPGGQIEFKTDDDGLFADSIQYFKDSGFTITFLTYDLHQSDFPDNVMTEHEEKFTAQNIPIKMLCAVWNQDS